MTSDDLPAGLALAWGLRPTPTKGPRRTLTLDRIVGAAIELARSDGLDAVSMGRVAKEVGVSTMALYRYVDSKDELLALMMDQAAGEVALHPPDADWRAGLRRWARSYYRLLDEHRWLARVPLTAPPATPRQFTWLEDLLHAMRDTGLDSGEMLSVVMLLGNIVRAEARLRADMEDAQAAAGTTDAEAMAGYAAFLRRVVDPTKLPRVAKLIADGVMDAGDPPEASFEWSLERALDGIAVLVDARRGNG